jgi:hypothetical protein
LKLTGRLRKLASLALVEIGPQLNSSVSQPTPIIGRSSLLRRFIPDSATDALVGLGDDKPFAVRLGQTIAWCESRADIGAPEASLRYVQLRPRLLEHDRVTSVHGVVRQRASYPPASEAPTVISRDIFRGGRLLAHFPDADLADGAAELETGGFFDVNNVPPWDTWVGLFRDPAAGDSSYAEYLVAWVPAAFVPLAGRGIDVNPEECVAWLSETPTRLAAELRARDLLA